ncbi:MAG: aldo/keto reductase, partial [Candidatus Micrarchaeaceae archaeon]
ARGAINYDKQLYLKLNEFAEKYGKSPSQIALNYVISHKGVIAIPKASSKEHMDQNAGAVGWRLSKQDIAILSNSKGLRSRPLAGKALSYILKRTSSWSRLMALHEKNRHVAKKE